MARRPGKTRKTTRRTAAPARRRSTKAPAKTTTRPTQRAAAKKATAPKRAAKTVAKKRPVTRTAAKPVKKPATRSVSRKPVARTAAAAPAKATGLGRKATTAARKPAPARKPAASKPVASKPAATPRPAPVAKAKPAVVAPAVATLPVAAAKVPAAETPRQAPPPVKEMRRVPPVPKRTVAVPVIDLDPEDQESELPLFPSTPSSLDIDHAPQRVREDEAKDAIGRHPRAGVDEAVVAGDPDADANAAATTGDEAPGGENPTPGQDDVELIGRSLGVEYDDDEELRGGAEIYERDRHRWELDPASSDDFRDRLKDNLGPKRPKG